MRATGVAVGVVVLAVVVVTAQLAFTDVGRELGSDWSPPAEIAGLDATRDHAITSVAVAGPQGTGSGGDPDAGDGRGQVAWISRAGDEWRVQTAALTIRDGTVAVGSVETVARSSVELVSVDVAAGPSPALVWERQPDNEIELARPGATPRVVSNGSLRVAEPAVALVDGTPVVAWQAYGADGYAVVARHGESGVVQQVGAAVSGRHSPRVTTAGDRVGVVWVDPDGTSIRARQAAGGTPFAFGPEQTLGPARPLGGIGRGQGAVSLAVDSDAAGIRAAWTDVGRVTVGGVAWGGDPVQPREVARGSRPGLATDGDRWLAAWLVEHTASGSDVDYATGDDAGASIGPVSRLASSANHPEPAFAPDPGLVWTERGTRTRLLSSAYAPGRTVGVLGRLTDAAGRFAFVGLAAVLVGAASVVVLPWTVFGYVLAFVLTTRFVRDRVVRLLAWLSRRLGRPRSGAAVDAALRAVPAGTWVAAFAVLETALLLALLPASVRTTTLAFGHPLGVSLVAAAGTVPVLLATDVRSAWRASFVFVYLQTAALWTTALPVVM